MTAHAIKFFLKLLLISCILLFLVLIISFHIQGNKFFSEISYGFCGGLIIFTLGFFSVCWSLKKSIKTFMVVVIGGIMVRFLLIAGLIFWVIRYTSYNVFVFVLSLVAFYLVLQFFEFRFFNATLKKGNK